MDSSTLTLPIAFLAGLLSFASPCVLPLVPAYIGYLGGAVVLSGEPAKMRWETVRTFTHSLLFVLGFTAVFSLLGASATFIGRLLLDYSLLLQRVGGVMLVIFGMRLLTLSSLQGQSSGWSRRQWVLAAAAVALLTFLFDSRWIVQGRLDATAGQDALLWLEESVMMGLVVLAGADWGVAQRVILAAAAGTLNFLASFDTWIPNLIASLLIAVMTLALNQTTLFYSEKRLEIGQVTGAPDRPWQADYLRSFLFGVVFAAGWTPCIGPILAAILIVASQLQTVGQGVLLLAAYSLGLAIPFLIVGLALGPLSHILRRVNRYVGIVSVVSGLLLVVMGILIFTDSLGFLAQYGNLLELEWLTG